VPKKVTVAFIFFLRASPVSAAAWLRLRTLSEYLVFCYRRCMASTEAKRNNPAMYGRLTHIFELLGEAQDELTQAFALQGAAPPATYKALDKAWQAVQKAAEHIDEVRYK